jgi:hypothetical protein
MERPDSAVGLCATCQYCRLVPTARATFYLCERSFVDNRFRKYPPLPVLRCPGYEPKAEQGSGEPGKSGF